MRNAFHEEWTRNINTRESDTESVVLIEPDKNITKRTMQSLLFDFEDGVSGSESACENAD